LPWSDWSRRYVSLVGHVGPSHVLFSAETLNPQHATFLNVTFGSSFDADDTHVGAMLHPGVATWSAALAMAEYTGASGPDVLAAVVAGYEVAIRIGLAVQPSHFKRGFQSTGTCDGFGTAAAAGRLLLRGMDAERRIAEATTIALDDEVEAASNELSTAVRVSVTLRDGRKFSKLVPAPKGSPSQPFTEAEHEARFIQELSNRVPIKVCSEIVAMSRNLDQLDPHQLGRALSGASV
jgi:2-methylcitrate dehydratase PrpD